MLETRAVVIESMGGVALVEAYPRAACGHCSASSGCATGVLARIFGDGPKRFYVDDPIGARPGEQVIVGVADGALSRACAIVYLFPLIFVIAGAAAGALSAGTSHQDLAAAGGATLGLAAGYAWIRGASRARRGDRRLRPFILARAEAQYSLLIATGKDAPC